MGISNYCIYRLTAHYDELVSLQVGIYSILTVYETLNTTSRMFQAVSYITVISQIYQNEVYHQLFVSLVWLTLVGVALVGLVDVGWF